jgi:hypothetical protein
MIFMTARHLVNAKYAGIKVITTGTKNGKLAQVPPAATAAANSLEQEFVAAK